MAKVRDRMLLGRSKKHDNLTLQVTMRGGDVCIAAATDEMADGSPPTWVYMPLHLVCALAVRDFDDRSANQVAESIRAQVEAGISTGTYTREAKQ